MLLRRAVTNHLSHGGGSSVGDPLSIGLPDDEVLRRTVTDALRLGIDLRDKVKRYRVVSHPQDFYRIAMGTEALRPAQQKPVLGVILAGHYTRQPFVASMEGAVISGRHAAETVNALGH